MLINSHVELGSVVGIVYRYFIGALLSTMASLNYIMRSGSLT